jgi:hypothetical protein
LTRLLSSALLSLALVLSPPAAAAQEPAAPAAGEAVAETITIPFDPPIGTPLTYAMRFERKRERGDNVVDFEQRLTFERLGEGYLLRLETLALANGGQRFDLADKRVMAAVPAGMRPYVMPMTIELDAAGEMLRMRDWDNVQAAMRQLPETVAAMTGQPMDETKLAAFRSVLAPIVNSSAEDAPALLIRGWPAMLGYGGSTLASGAMAELATEIATPFSPTPIPAFAQGSVSRTPEANISLVQTTRFDPEVIRTLTLELVDRLQAQGGLKGPGVPAEAILGLDIADEVAVTFDPVTGLPITGRITRIATVTTPDGPMGGGEITTITRIAP